ncbi:LysR family transcriptional regulator [Cupriavidus necator]|uniref:Regulatory protein, LysR:LysR, substrate-binding protein n=1 Tax=Cupriavidus pinatubonensis (strain JMP 134 / LMG 1197) TaxID=264198 RepID=Q46PS8_CUPPJ|nr:LysR family transcriptional regulator [Cupriavidus necator]
MAFTPTADTLESASFPLSRLKLRHLRIIVALGEMQTAASVAARIHVSPAAVSKTLAEIEDIVGMPLFVRGRRGLELTEAGRELATHGQVLLTQLGRLADSMQAVRAGNQGELRVAFRTMSVQPFLAQAMSDFYRDNPRVEISVIEGGIGELTEQLLQGSLDLLFAYDDPRLSRPALRSTPVVPAQKVVIVASPDHPLLARRKFTAQALSEQQWCIPAAGSRMLHLLHTAFHALGAPAPSQGIRTSDVAATASLMQTGHYLSVFPERIAAQLASAKVARVLRFELDSRVEPVVAVWNGQITPRTAAHRFRDFVLQRATQDALGDAEPLLAARAVAAAGLAPRRTHG